MRRIRIPRKLFLGLLLSLCVAAGAAAQANDSLAVARRVVAATSLAAKEYANGVAPHGGRVLAASEVEEATQFLDGARWDIPGLPAAVRAAADSGLGALRAMIVRTAPPDSVTEQAATLIQRIAAAAGGALDLFPARPPSLARGAAVFREQCVPCHGPAGRGDGPKAKHLRGPPPASLADRDAMRGVSPVDVYRKLTIGVAGTAMPQFEESLSPEDRWAVALYVATLRADERTVHEGEGLYAAHCALCHGAGGGGDGGLAASLSVRPPALRDLAVQGRFSDEELGQLTEHGRPGTPMPGFAHALDATEVARLIAFLRTLPAAERQTHEASPVAATFAVVRRQLDSAVALRSERLAFDAYITFEQVETAVRAKNAALAGDLEDAFAALRRAAAAGAGPADLDAVHARLLAGLERAERLVADRSSGPNLFMQSFVLLLREGFEAILIVAALMAFLLKAGAVERRRHVARGAWAAVGASILTAVVIELLFEITPGQREALEGATMLLATAVLFYVSYWLLSKIEVAKWHAFVKGRMEDALSTGSGLALASVAFLAVYREGFETILFYKALLTSAGGGGGGAAVAAGILAGCVALVLVYVAIDRFGVKVPLRPFFAVTSAMLYYMAFVFAGKGIADLQEAGLVRTSVVEWAPRIPVLGIYPTVQSLALQLLLLALLVVAVVWLQRRRVAAAAEDRRRPSFP
ncbi:MAG TPA: FTR1 family protein [Gemmatimonadales bacterium]|nr:FTR1 family protein [Gemmatimonadales bacterium]